MKGCKLRGGSKERRLKQGRGGQKEERRRNKEKENK